MVAEGFKKNNKTRRNYKDEMQIMAKDIEICRDENYYRKLQKYFNI